LRIKLNANGFFLVSLSSSGCIFERPFEFSLLDQKVTSLWLVIVTMASVGYGDVFPKTGLGRLSVFVGAVFGGALLVSLLTPLILENLVVAHQVSSSSSRMAILTTETSPTTAATAATETAKTSANKVEKRNAESFDSVFLLIEKQKLEKERRMKSIELIAVAWRLYVLHNKTRMSVIENTKAVLTKQMKRHSKQFFALTHDLRRNHHHQQQQQQQTSHTMCTTLSSAVKQSLFLPVFTAIDQFALENHQKLYILEKEIEKIGLELDTKLASCA